MGLFNHTKFDSLNDLFIRELEDLYDAERRLVGALPKMAESAHDPQLAGAFVQHLDQTGGHVTRLERIFQLIGQDPKRETCPAMKGLIQEAEEMVDATGDEIACDAALIAAGQRIEHYEMAGYGAARALAQRIGRDDAATLLQQTLDEEGAADKRLTQIAESSVNAAR